MIMNGNAARDMRETGAVKKRAWFPFSERKCENESCVAIVKK